MHRRPTIVLSKPDKEALAWKEVVENRRRYKGLLYKGKAFFDRINETNKRIKSSFVLKLAHTMCNYPITSLF